MYILFAPYRSHNALRRPSKCLEIWSPATHSLPCFLSLLSTCRSHLLFASLHERRNFGVDRRIAITMEVYLFQSVVPPACNVILQCMHI